MNDIVSESGGNKYASIPDAQIPKVIDDVKKRKAIVLEARNTIYKQYTFTFFWKSNCFAYSRYGFRNLLFNSR